MKIFRKKGLESSGFPSAEDRKMAKFICDVFGDEFKNIKTWPEFEAVVKSNLDRINKKLELEGQEPITEISKDVWREIDDIWGLSHVGVDY